MGREQGRLAFALLLSLLFHAVLLSMIFGGQGLGLPGFGFPWGDRRIDVPDVRVVLVPTDVTAGGPAITSVGKPAITWAAKPLQQASIEPSVATGPASTPSMSRAPRVGRKAEAIPPAAQITAGAKSKRNAVARAASVKAPTRADGSDHVAPAKIPEPAVVDAAPSDTPASVVREAPSEPTPVIAVAPSASSPETVTSALRDAGDVAREAAELAAAELEAQRQEAARQEEAARVEAARREAEPQEAARRAAAQEAQRQEVARQEEAGRVEAARREGERQEAAQRAAAQEAQRQEVARQEEAARVEAARREAERQEAARVRAEQEAAAAKREARLRAIGRQLDEEAARREESSTAARLPSTLPLSYAGRRVRLWGRTDPNAELIRYAEAWERKIHLNTPVDTVREVAKRLRINPMVTVAIRSDGSVESVTFVLSSGMAEVDDAIRRIVQSHEHYQAFPPALASDVDVIEIRRTWYFDTAVRFY
jgi:outer membrane biosynthesis protein TonB